MSNQIVRREPSVRAEVISRRTYSRPKLDGSFENWDEVVDRVIHHQRWLWQRALGDRPLNKIQEEELEDLRVVLLDRKGSVSGRTLWLGGTEVSKKRESSQYNCSYTKVESVHDVVDAFWLLLQGCGVGFEPVVGTLNGFTQPMEIELVRSERHLLEQKKGREHNLEAVSSDGERIVWTISIGDSAEAWAKAVGKLMAGKQKADVLRLDFSQIRPAGERLRGYGWISSGDLTFAPALDKIAQIMNKEAGQLLSRIDIMDVMNHLGTTLSSRRSAEIALVPWGDPEWQEFATAKKDFWLHGNEHRQQSNNSLVFKAEPSVHALANIFELMESAGGSEPGFINEVAGKRRAPWLSGVNPCAEILLPNKGFCVAKDTPLILKNGISFIRDVIGVPVEIFNGVEWSTVIPFQTGKNEKLYRVAFGDGSWLDVTANHRFSVADRFSKGYVEKKTHELLDGKYRLHTQPFTMTKVGGSSVEHAYTIGFYVGDGNGNRIDIYNESKAALPLAGTRGSPSGPQVARIVDLPFDWAEATKLKSSLRLAFGWDEDSILDFVSGLADADGSGAANGVRIYQANEDFCRELQLLLTSVGIRSSVNFMAPAGQKTNLGVRLKAVWYVQITDTSKLRCKRLSVGNKKVGNRCKNQTILSVTELPGLHDSFCFTEPKMGMGVFNNSLTYQCNLVELNLSAFNTDLDGLWSAARLLARANYRQTCANLEDGILQRVWHENNEFLRLCGVGITGLAQWTQEHQPTVLRQLRKFVRAEANKMADELGLPHPKAVTTVKPSGTLSKIMDCTEGAHTPLGKYIFNNVRFSKHDPYVGVLKKAKYRVFDDPSSKDAVLVTFPVAFENVKFDVVDGKEVNLESAVAQLERYKMLMQCWVDHNASITVSYDPSEVPEIVAWLIENWDYYVGVSFLYRTDPTKTAEDLGYLYMPQQVVEKETYLAYTATLKPLGGESRTAATLKEEDKDYEIDAGLECAGGMCPVR